MQVRMHLNYCQITILLLVDPLSSSAYIWWLTFPPAAGNLPKKVWLLGNYQQMHVQVTYICVYVCQCMCMWMCVHWCTIESCGIQHMIAAHTLLHTHVQVYTNCHHYVCTIGYHCPCNELSDWITLIFLRQSYVLLEGDVWTKYTDIRIAAVHVLLHSNLVFR